MADQVETSLKHFIRLEVLMTQACGTLRKTFKERWKNFAGEVWVNSPTSGHEFITTLGRNVYRKADPLWRKNLENGDINSWDLLLLSQIFLDDSFEKGTEMENEDLLKEKTCIQQLVDVRHKMSHDATKTYDEKELLILWNKVVMILAFFGYSEDKLDEFRVAENIEEVDFGTTNFLNADNVNEADCLKEQGNTEFKAGNLDKSLQLYTEAINLSDISDQVLATLYSNRAAVFINQVEKLKCSEDKNNAKENALRNAENAVNLYPNWWKGHFRLGKALEMMGELKKAVFAFDCAVVLNPTDEVVRKMRDDCRHKFTEREIKECLCSTRLQHYEKPLLMEEGTLKAYMNKCKEGEKLLTKKGDPRAYILKAHRLRYGLDGKPDYQVIASLYEKAANKGCAEGMFNLAMLTKDGLGVSKDIKRAVVLLNQAADEPSIINHFPNPGVAEAEYEIGCLYMEGNGLQLNPEVAVHWLQRSSENGNGCAAYALGKVYMNGLGVKMDEKRGLEYWKLAASRKLVDAMESLYGYFLKQLNPEQAKKWFAEALENGSVKAKENRKSFQESLRNIPTKPEILELSIWEKENGLDAGELPLIERYMRMQSDVNPKSKYFINELLSQVTRMNNLKLPYGGGSNGFDFTQIKAFADKGSKTAQIMHSASEHFSEGVKLLKTIAQPVSLYQAIHHFAECYRLEPIVAVWSGEVHNIFSELVKHLLKDTSKREVSSLDRDLHVCYAHLTMNNLRETLDFANKAIARYPDEKCLYALQIYVYAFLNDFKEGLLKAKNALKLFPNDVQLLNTKANSIKFLDTFDVKDRISAFEDYLKVAEIDDRGVPDAHYIISFHYSTLVDKHRDSRSSESKRKFKEFYKLMVKHYEMGLESEKLQLPCFLPFNSEMKKFMGLTLEMEGSVQPRHTRENEPVTRISSEHDMPGKQISLTDPTRLQVIRDHRQTLSNREENEVVYRTSQKLCMKKKTAPQVTGLNEMTLRDMNPNKNCVYKGRVLKVTSIEDAIVGSTSIRLVVQDENNYVQRCRVYNFSKCHNMQEKLGFGCKFSLANPDVRVMKDGKLAILVEDPMSQLLPSDRDNKRCRFCGKGDSSLKCSRCRKAFYCSKECQTQDWKLLKHTLVCTSAP